MKRRIKPGRSALTSETRSSHMGSWESPPCPREMRRGSSVLDFSPKEILTDAVRGWANPAVAARIRAVQYSLIVSSDSKQIQCVAIDHGLKLALGNAREPRS